MAPVSPYALELRNVSFAFAADQKPFFDGLSVAFAAGQLHFMCGRNGVGKSVFFDLIRGVHRPHANKSGTFLLHGTPYEAVSGEALPIAYSSRIKLVRQNFDLMLADRFTFEQNLQLALLPQFPGIGHLATGIHVPPMVKKFGIDMHKQVRHLSGGQRQILAMLMMLQKPCDILLLDEPTAALDEQNTEMVMDFLRDVVAQTGLTAIVISHDKEQVQHYAPSGYFSIATQPGVTQRSIVFQPHE